MKKIEAKIIADSINQQGDRITTYLLTFPRFILAELNTHRVFSKNSASSRAIPFKKMVEMVENDPFIPIAWQKRHSGMQGSEYFTDTEMPNTLEENYFENRWLEYRDSAVENAKKLNSMGITKQLTNRLLEPFMWHTVLLTATEFENFFNLRCPIYRAFGNVFKSKKDCIKKYPTSMNLTDLDWLQSNESQAEIHIQALAEAMWDAMNESTPKELKAGEWHIPFGYTIDLSHSSFDKFKYEERGLTENEMNLLEIKVSTARCARLSYMTFDGKIDYEKDIKLHDTLLESQHMSPFEHCARAMSEDEYYQSYKGNDLFSMPQYNEKDMIESYLIETSVDKEDESFGWCRNFKGFIQYRYLIENNDN